MTWKRISSIVTLTAALVAFTVAGCDTKPKPPKAPGGGEVKFIEVDTQDAAEYETVGNMEAARLDYRFRLKVLEAYYEKTGNLDKLRWTRREMKNLEEAQTFEWQGVGVDPPSGESVQSTDERLIVERTIVARQAWKDAVLETYRFYKGRNEDFRAAMVRSIIARFDPIRTYMYFLDAEIPSADLEPTQVVPEADDLYEEAYRLYREGKGFLSTFVTTDYDKQRQALVLFRKLVKEYPRSTKIARSAYFIAEIYKEYFDENVRAVHWYRRAWQWDPDIDQPARFQAATVYDYDLSDDEKAVELYRESMKNDPYRLLNYEHARDRIIELTKKKKR
ncbi:MAG: tetratricopeptide repeat protein [Planctomycetota bacterium]